MMKCVIVSLGKSKHTLVYCQIQLEMCANELYIHLVETLSWNIPILTFESTVGNLLVFSLIKIHLGTDIGGAWKMCGFFFQKLFTVCKVGSDLVKECSSTTPLIPPRELSIDYS